ncbi:MAG TPA: thiamine diphosphokinase [Caldisericia bacterium]|nr:thiamine diphosphokinase [Caldisericia bacterium]
MLTIVGPLCTDSDTYLHREFENTQGLLIALDGGIKLLRRVGKLPDLWFGDMDSASPDEITALERKEVKIFQYPTEKDYSDFELALQYLESHHHFSQVSFYGMLGGRLDHMLINLALVKAYLPDLDKLCFHSQTLDIYLINSKNTLTLSSLPGRLVSLIPFEENIEVISTSGLKYPLIHDILKPGSSRGLSNVCIANEVSIKIMKGNLLVFHYKEDDDENIS